MPIATQLLPNSFKRRVRDALGLIGLEVIPKRSNHWLAQMKIGTVLDVGANRGQFARFARGLFPAAQIYSFEPLEDCYHEVVTSFNTDSKFRAFNLAIGAEEASVSMHRNKFDASSSMLEMTDAMPRNFPFAKSISEVKVQVRRLDDVTRELPMEPELLLKIDVQGYEEPVLAGAPDILSRARLVIVEVSFEPLYAGQALFDAIYRRLTDLGFRYCGNWEQIVSPLDGRVLQADAIFLKP